MEFDENLINENTPSSHLQQKQNGVNHDYDSDDLDGIEESGDTTGLDKTDASDKEVVVLVVSDENRHKMGITEALTKNDFASWKEEKTLSGTRTLTRASPQRVIVDATPLQCMTGRSPTAIARRWISHNSLRRVIFNKYVVVVCVITCDILGAPCHNSIFGYDNCWVDVLRILFKTHRGGVLTVVNTYDTPVDHSIRKKVKRFVRDHEFETKNIIYTSTSSGADDVAMILEESVGMKGNIGVPRSSSMEAFRQRLSKSSCMPCISRTPREEGLEYKNINNTRPLVIRPHYMEEVTSKRKKYTAWGPERVILFGRTGSGKSTLAQMMTTGKLDPQATTFSYGSGIRGHTKFIQNGEGRGWYVVDTPGFGEPDDRESTITTEDVQRKIKRFVEMVDGVFAHFVFVLKKDRIDQLEINLWKFFKLLFGEEIKPQFSIVISNADKSWMEKEMDYLEKCFDGCDSFLCAEFPSTWTRTYGFSTDLSRQDLREEEEEIQKESLKELEEELAQLERSDRACPYGEHSTMNKVIERDRSNSDMRIERSLRTKMIVQGSEVMFQIDELASRLMSTLTVNDKVVLVPLNLA